MECLQYYTINNSTIIINESFKPCYKWNAFNTDYCTTIDTKGGSVVLNLVINGMPSIQLTDNSVIDTITEF